MHINLTLCDKNLIGDIRTYKFNIEARSDYVNEAQDLFYHWLETKKSTTSVYVCFESWDNGDYISYLFITDNWDDLTYFCEYKLGYNSDYTEIDFSVFEFENYEDALEYCRDLKEGM